MTDITAAGTYSLGDRTVNRMGYGAMQLAGPHVFGPPKDRGAAIGVLRPLAETVGRPHRRRHRTLHIAKPRDHRITNAICRSFRGRLPQRL